MKSIVLLSENDWNGVNKALQRMEQVELEVTLGNKKVRVSTVPVNSKVYNVATLVRVETWTPGVYSSQYFESVAEARRYSKQ